MKSKHFIFIFLFFTNITFGTSWDEPWQSEIIKQADYFVLAKIKSFNSDTLKIEVIKNLDGENLKGEIVITNFYLLKICSASGHGPEFDFENIEISYFFIKKNQKGEYCIPTPSSGFDYVKEENVIATYRHTYHQTRVPIETYEKTMCAIFNNYHNKPYDKIFINDYIDKNLTLKPAGFNEDEISTFFSQHVALECIYHLRITGFYSKILPFLNDLNNFHNQVSAARALIAYDNNECKKELLNVIEDSSYDSFIKVICIWTLSEFKPSELKQQLIKINEIISDEETGFGGNLMDPRVCTYIPNPKSALEKLISIL